MPKADSQLENFRFKNLQAAREARREKFLKRKMKATEQELDSCNLNANEVNEEDVNDKKEMSESENSSQESSQVNKTKRGPLSLSHSSPDDPKTCTYMQNGFIDCPLSTALNVWALWG